MTREDLKEHCKKQVEQIEMWAKHRGEEPSGRIYEEHKLVLELFEQEPKWIPVSERLPKENIPVLLTVEGPEFFGKARREVILASYQRLYKDNYSWLTYEDEPSIIIDLPIAWIPLPKPYNPQESEDV